MSTRLFSTNTRFSNDTADAGKRTWSTWAEGVNRNWNPLADSLDDILCRHTSTIQRNLQTTVRMYWKDVTDVCDRYGLRVEDERDAVDKISRLLRAACENKLSEPAAAREVVSALYYYGQGRVLSWKETLPVTAESAPSPETAVVSLQVAGDRALTDRFGIISQRMAADGKRLYQDMLVLLQQLINHPNEQVRNTANNVMLTCNMAPTGAACAQNLSALCQVLPADLSVPPSAANALTTLLSLCKANA